MGTIIQDLKYTLRMLRLSPGFTFIAVATLALGIGANTAIFSLINAVLLRPLPYPHPERMVQLLGVSRGETYPYTSVPRFNAYREQSQVLEQVAAYDWRGASPVSLTGGDRPEQLRGERVSFEYFHLFGAPFIAGRGFNPEEDRPGGGRFAILSAGFWQRRFASDRGVLGKSISLGGDPYTVIGVVSPTFEPDPPVDVWLPLQADPNSTDQATFFFAAARLRSGVTLDQAKTALRVAGGEFRRRFPQATEADGSFTAEPLSQNLTDTVRLPLLILLGAAACVLAIACANLANLLLARGAGRTREMAVRAAIGAGRARILRQFVAAPVPSLRKESDDRQHPRARRPGRIDRGDGPGEAAGGLARDRTAERNQRVVCSLRGDNLARRDVAAQASDPDRLAALSELTDDTGSQPHARRGEQQPCVVSIESRTAEIRAAMPRSETAVGPRLEGRIVGASVAACRN